jgi:hypothetical protein
MDRDFKKNLTTERVVILTAEVLIEGTIFHHQEIRLSDSLNAPQFRDNPYMTLADAVVTKIDTDHVVFRSNVLLVARSRILCITPKSEVLNSGLPTLKGQQLIDVKEEMAALSALPLKAGLPSPSPAPTEMPKELEAGSGASRPPLREKRSAPRRKANMHPVLITNGDAKAPPFEGWVVDRSAGGLRLVVKRPVGEGAMLTVRPARAPATFPWIKVEVRSSTTHNGNTNLGCRFVLKPTLEELQQFG